MTLEKRWPISRTTKTGRGDPKSIRLRKKFLDAKRPQARGKKPRKRWRKPSYWLGRIGLQY